MFPLAILIGVYSYLIFVLGIYRLFYPIPVAIVSVLWLVSLLVWFKNDILLVRKHINRLANELINLKKFPKLLVMLLIILWGISFFGLLAPERAFDALWYHLTLPKIFIEHNAIFYIPGGLFYYSLMPKLVDLLYVPALMMGGSIVAKMVHFSFGILTLVVIYKISKYFLPFTISLLVTLVFSTNLVVAWEATTAYIDLGRAYFEVMAFYGIVLFISEKKKLWLSESAIMLGFAISTKLIAVTSLPILVCIVLYIYRDRIKLGMRESVKYALTALAVPLPYFVYSTINTGNPVYPLFTKFYDTKFDTNILSPFKVVNDFFVLFVRGDDPVSPIYLIIAPLIFLVYKKLGALEKLVLIYSVVSLLMWYITPRTGGGRFILPYLPLLSLLVGIVINHTKQKAIRTLVMVIIIFLAGTTILYRAAASHKYVPVVLGDMTDAEFLTQNLQFDYGDFYDTDGYLTKTINTQDTVLIYGVHNLYYVNFPFIHESYVKKGDEFNYILSPTNSSLPERFYMFNPIYTNQITGVTLYSQGGTRWVY